MGLDALLPDRLEGEFFLCPVEDIRPSPQQPRHQFPEESLQDLAQSIRELEGKGPLSEEVTYLLDFIKSSKRGVCFGPKSR
jgi:hypothetical protein